MNLKKVVIGALAGTGMALATVVPASAHILVVDNGNSEPKAQWVGGGPLPANANGQGLIPGGPTGSYLQPPSHMNGLNSACEAIRANGNGVVVIFGPPTPAGCAHGT